MRSDFQLFTHIFTPFFVTIIIMYICTSELEVANNSYESHCAVALPSCQLCSCIGYFSTQTHTNIQTYNR